MECNRDRNHSEESEFEEAVRDENFMERCACYMVEKGYIPGNQQPGKLNNISATMQK